MNDGNLRPFKKGQSGNPAGRPPGLSLTRLVREELQKPAVEGSSVTKGEMVASRIVAMAQAGDRVFAPLVWRYVDGDPKDSTERALLDLAEQLAPKLGLTPEALVAEFKREMGAA